MPASPRFFTISDIANCLDVSSRTVRRWIDDKLLVARRIKGVVRISEADCGNAQKEHVPTGAIFRLKARRGPKKALLAVAASILTIVYHMLRNGTCYHDLGPNTLRAAILPSSPTESATSAIMPRSARPHSRAISF